MFVSWRRAVDVAVSFLLLVNIPLVLVFETQALLPTWLFPRFLQGLLKWHVHANGDFFLRRSPPFYVGMIFADIFIRVPLMFLNAYAFYYRKSWGHITAILYGVHTASMMIPVLFEICFARISKRHRLLLAFVPQFLIAVYMVLHVLLVDQPFSFRGAAGAPPAAPLPNGRAGGRRRKQKKPKSLPRRIALRDFIDNASIVVHR